MALEECDPEFALELGHRLRESGLGDVLARRGAGEVLLVGQGHQVAQLAKLHKQSL